MKPGQISDPVVTDFGVHIIKVDSLVYAGRNVEKVKARHILLKFQPGADTRAQIEKKVDAFLEDVSKSKQIIAKADEDSLESIQTPFFEKDQEYIPTLTSNAGILIKRIFRAKKGTILPKFETDQGFFIIKVAKVSKAGVPPLEDVRKEVEKAMLDEHRTKVAQEFIARIDQRLKSGMTLEEAVGADENKDVQVQQGDVTRAGMMPDGQYHPLTVSFFALKNPGESTGPVNSKNGAGIAVLTKINPVDETRYESERDELKSRMSYDIKNEVLSTYIEGLKKEAKIVDNVDRIMGNL
jgi:peptidyl-prolyl cis-trans isomerase D